MQSLLARSAVYNTFEDAVGARRYDRRVVEEYVRPRSGHRILDLGCGTSRVLATLPTDTSYVGFDNSPDYIAAARHRWGDRGEFHCADLGDADVPTGSFERVLIFGVLHHLDDDVCHAALGLAARALSGGGRLVAVEPARTQGQNPIARWLIDHDRGDHVRSADRYAALAQHHFDTVTVTPRTDLLRVPYTHAVIEAGSVG